MERQEKANWKCVTTLRKYREDIMPFRKEGREAEFHKLFKPYEERVIEGNCLLNTGIDEMWDIIIGAEATDVFTNALTTIGVGDSSAAADATQTDLQAAVNKQYNAMEATYPSHATQACTFKSSFATAEANYSWNEWVVKHSVSTICLNRKVESLGTKSSGTWTLEVSITLS